ncbi:MAG: hypothetical protein VB035_00570 [Candidatus Fimivivens sp.]|nr:hypothetical protein [Candidatus Fimivivens sp.]
MSIDKTTGIEITKGAKNSTVDEQQLQLAFIIVNSKDQKRYALPKNINLLDEKHQDTWE